MTAFVVGTREGRPVHVVQCQSVAEAEARYADERAATDGKPHTRVELFAGSREVVARAYPHLFAAVAS